MKLISLNRIATESLHAAGYSSVKVLQSVNADLNNLKHVNPLEPGTAGKPKTTKETKNKPSEFRISSSKTDKYSGSPTIALRFLEWSSMMEQVWMKYPAAEIIQDKPTPADYLIPHMFKVWLDKFAKKDETVVA